jgi:hypothetical protein
MSFLSTLAQYLISTYGTDLSQVTVVFPNKRASLFLNEELVQLSDRPLWSPAYITISDLFRSLSDLQVADPIKLVCDLHKSFVHCTGSDTSLDHFYGWGQLLLSDFDDVDKHLAPADKVFANLRDIHEFDDDTYLTQQQRDIIRKFFSNFNEDHNSELKQRFLSLWSHLGDIYHDFNARLAAQGLAYEGALYREVVTTLKDSVVSFKKQGGVLDRGSVLSSQNIPHEEERRASARLCRLLPEGRKNFWEGRDQTSVLNKEYVFAGFNLLHPVEQALIDSFGTRAKVIQDTDEETPKHIMFISATTENSQARYVATWLKENDRIQAGRKTAIVLADETLLQTVIHCLPPEVSKVNITTGYPLSQTATAQGMGQNVLASLRWQASHEDSVVSLKKHSAREGTTSQRSALPLATGGTQELFERNNTVLSQTTPLEQEAQYRLYTILERLQTLIDSGDLQVSDATLQRLLTQIIASTTIPFHGEPIEGIQIMGVLETRNIDFDHVLLLSCNEGNIPKGINDTSFIPYSIRKAYGLTTVDNKVAIYANYFRRLLQRAKDVTLVYNNATNDGKTGEMSRFMLQLMVESKHPITYRTLQTGQTPALHHPQPIPKTPSVMERLNSIRQISPSALSLYLRCPLRFFYQNVCGLSEYEDLDDDLIDNRLFGNIFHKSAQLLYTSLSGDKTFLSKNIPHEDEIRASARLCRLLPEGRKNFLKGRSCPISPDVLDALLKSKVEIERAVDQAIKLELFHIEDPMAKMPKLNGLHLINREVIIRYLRQLVEIDLRHAPFSILGLETPLYSEFAQILSFTKHSCVPSVASEQSSSAARGGTPIQDVLERKNLTTLRIGGIVDRIDLISLPDGTERIRVVDYKTGSSRLKPLPDIASIFDPTYVKNHSDYYLQTILYSCLINDSAFLNQTRDRTLLLENIPHEEERRARTFSKEGFCPIPDGRPVSPCLLFIQHAGAEDYDPTLVIGNTPITDINMVKDEFIERLHALLSEIFDPERPFLPTEERTRCQSCPFTQLCY